MVNLRGAPAPNSHLFSLLCDEVENEHQKCLGAEVGELSGGKVLIHSCELLSNRHIFCSDFGLECACCFADEL